MAAVTKRQLSKTSTAYIAVGVVLITIMAIIGMSAFMRTKEFIVNGASLYSVEEIVEASGLDVGDNLIFVNPQTVSQRIRETLPFITVANVSRVLPDTVRIEVTESVAIASITFAGEVYVIDSSGRVLERVGREGAEGSQSLVENVPLIEVRGVEIEETLPGNTLRPVFGTETKLQYMQDVLDALEREGLASDVSYLDVSNIVNVFFGYRELYRVILGGSTSLRPSNLRHKIGMLEDSANQIVAQYPNISGRIHWEHESGRASFTRD